MELRSIRLLKRNSARPSYIPEPDVIPNDPDLHLQWAVSNLSLPERELSRGRMIVDRFLLDFFGIL